MTSMKHTTATTATATNTTNVLPAIKGLFAKGQTACNGWARCTKDKVQKLEDKILKAGKTGTMRIVDTKRRRNADYSESYMRKYQDNEGNVVYLMCTNGMEEDWPGGSGKFTYGNVDIYRGSVEGTGYYDGWFNKFAA